MSTNSNALSIIVAVDEEGGYAKGKEIPWSFQADWKHFKEITDGQVCVMGRGTYQDIEARRQKGNPYFEEALPGRLSYVISSTLDQAQGATVVKDVYEAAKQSPADKKIFLLGGFRLWVQYWHSVGEIWMTIVPGKYDTTKKFPVGWIDKEFTIVEGRKEQTQQGDILFVHYARRGYNGWQKRWSNETK